MSYISSNRGVVVLLCILLCSCARHFHAQGIVLAVDSPGRTLTISHRAIPGYMEAMAMPSHVDAATNLAPLQPGSRIDFELKVTHSAAVVRHVHLQQTELADIPVPKAEGKIAIGERMPDFLLTDQNGKT